MQYTIDSEFEKILEQLYKTGMCVGIKSFDPNIDDVLLAKKVKAMKYPVKVIRSKTVEDIPHTFERCDSGIVSKRSVKDLLRTVTLCGAREQRYENRYNSQDTRNAARRRGYGLRVGVRVGDTAELALHGGMPARVADTGYAYLALHGVRTKIEMKGAARRHPSFCGYKVSRRSVKPK